MLRPKCILTALAALVFSACAAGGVLHAESRDETHEYLVLHNSAPLAKRVDAIVRSSHALAGVAPKESYAALSKAEQRALLPEIAVAKATLEDETREERLRLRNALSSLQFGSIDQKDLNGSKVVANFSVLRGITSAQRDALQAQGYVLVENRKVEATLTDSSELLRMPQVWSRQDRRGQSLTGRGVRIGVLDTGIDYTHADFGACTRAQFLAGSCRRVVGGYDFVNDDADPADDHFHGTHVAGIIGADGAVRGMAPESTLYAYKVLSASGSGTWSQIIAGVERCMDPNSDGDFSDHLDVLNISIGGGGNADDLPSQALDRAMEIGVTVVVAAGNSGPDSATISTPGSSRKAITVGASFGRAYPSATVHGISNPTTASIPNFSGRGPAYGNNVEAPLAKPDVVAPGVYVCSSQRTGRTDSPCLDSAHRSVSGTSMATPHVAGIAALLKQLHPAWTPQDIKNALIESAEQLIDPRTQRPHPANVQGSGRINPLAALQLTQAPEVPRRVALLTDGVHSTSQVQVQGVVEGPDLVGYRLEIASLGSADWRLVTAHEGAPVGPVLGEIQLNEFAAGTHTLRLTADFVSGRRSDYAEITFRNTLITDPPEDPYLSYRSFSPLNVYGPNGSLSVRGTARGVNFSHYTLAWCLPERASQCSTHGFVLPHNGMQAVENGVLGELQLVPELRTGFVSIVLTTYSTDGSSERTEANTFVHREIKQGFPFDIFSGSDTDVASADFDGDPGDEVLLSTCDSVYLYKFPDTILAGWPVPLLPEAGCEGAINPTAADMDGDGRPEALYYSSGMVHVRDVHGQALPGWPRSLSGRDNLFVPVVLSGQERGIVYSDGPRTLGLLDIHGTMAAGWPITLPQSESALAKGSIAVGDITGDGESEIVVVTAAVAIDDTQPARPIVLHAYNLQGRALVGFPKQFNSQFHQRYPLLADLDGDGTSDVLMTTLNTSSHTITVFGFHGNGALVRGFPVTVSTTSSAMAAPSAGDLDADGKAEVVFSDGNCLHVLNSDGSIRSGWPICDTDARGIGRQLNGSPIIGNIDGDSEPEILVSGYPVVGSLPFVYGFDPSGREHLDNGFPLMILNVGPSYAGVLADLDADGVNELIDRGAYRFAAYALRGCANSNEPWGHPFGDAERSRRSASGGLGRCSIPVSSAPQILRAPGDIFVDGNSYQRYFDVDAVGQGELQYQWQRLTNGTWETVVTSRSSILSFSQETLPVRGTQFRVVVSNSLGAVTSSPATVRGGLFEIISQPQDQFIIEGEIAELIVGVSALSDVSYQWYKNGTLMQGEERPTLRLALPRRESGARFAVEVRAHGPNGDERMMSREARVEVAARPVEPPTPTPTAVPTASPIATPGATPQPTVTPTPEGTVDPIVSLRCKGAAPRKALRSAMNLIRAVEFVVRSIPDTELRTQTLSKVVKSRKSLKKILQTDPLLIPSASLARKHVRRLNRIGEEYQPRKASVFLKEQIARARMSKSKALKALKC